MEQVILQVSGMTCGGCEQAVTRAVSRLEGVSKVTASHAANQVTVEYEAAKVGRRAITEAIAKAGYQVSLG